MTMNEKMQLSFLVYATIGCLTLVFVSSHTTHIVGDRNGWNLPSYNGFYENWGRNRTFLVGDTLVFQYHPGLHTVLNVNKEDYGNCTTRDVLQTYFRGNTSIPLDQPGNYYFFCSVGKHCEAGQKLAITVSQPQAQAQAQANPPSK